jgi:hypothetical protein
MLVLHLHPERPFFPDMFHLQKLIFPLSTPNVYLKRHKWTLGAKQKRGPSEKERPRIYAYSHKG